MEKKETRKYKKNRKPRPVSTTPAKTDTNPNRIGRRSTADVDKVRAALTRSCGVIVEAAAYLGVGTQTVHNYVKRYELGGFVTDLRERLDDVALSTVVDDLGDIETAKWYLTWRQRSIIAANGLNLNIGDGNVNVVVVSEEDASAISMFIGKGGEEDAQKTIDIANEED